MLHRYYTTWAFVAIRISCPAYFMLPHLLSFPSLKNIHAADFQITGRSSNSSYFGISAVGSELETHASLGSKIHPSVLEQPGALIWICTFKVVHLVRLAADVNFDAIYWCVNIVFSWSSVHSYFWNSSSSVHVLYLHWHIILNFAYTYCHAKIVHACCVITFYIIVLQFPHTYFLHQEEYTHICICMINSMSLTNTSY